MSDDFCLLHGYEYMKSQMGDPVPYCEKCDRRADAMSDERRVNLSGTDLLPMDQVYNSGR